MKQIFWLVVRCLIISIIYILGTVICRVTITNWLVYPSAVVMYLGIYFFFQSDREIVVLVNMSLSILSSVFLYFVLLEFAEISKNTLFLYLLNLGASIIVCVYQTRKDNMFNGLERINVTAAISSLLFSSIINGIVESIHNADLLAGLALITLSAISAVIGYFSVNNIIPLILKFLVKGVKWMFVIEIN